MAREKQVLMKRPNRLSRAHAGVRANPKTDLVRLVAASIGL